MFHLVMVECMLERDIIIIIVQNHIYRVSDVDFFSQLVTPAF